MDLEEAWQPVSKTSSLASCCHRKERGPPLRRKARNPARGRMHRETRCWSLFSKVSVTPVKMAPSLVPAPVSRRRRSRGSTTSNHAIYCWEWRMATGLCLRQRVCAGRSVWMGKPWFEGNERSSTKRDTMSSLTMSALVFGYRRADKENGRHFLRDNRPNFHCPILIRPRILQHIRSAHGDRVNDVGHSRLF
jgi:hypothetical protein